MDDEDLRNFQLDIEGWFIVLGIVCIIVFGIWYLPMIL